MQCNSGALLSDKTGFCRIHFLYDNNVFVEKKENPMERICAVYYHYSSMVYFQLPLLRLLIPGIVASKEGTCQFDTIFL